MVTVGAMTRSDVTSYKVTQGGRRYEVARYKVTRGGPEYSGGAGWWRVGLGWSSGCCTMARSNQPASYNNPHSEQLDQTRCICRHTQWEEIHCQPVVHSQVLAVTCAVQLFACWFMRVCTPVQEHGVMEGQMPRLARHQLRETCALPTWHSRLA